MSGPLFQTKDQWSIDLRNLRNPYQEKLIIGVMWPIFTFEQSFRQADGRFDCG